MSNFIGFLENSGRDPALRHATKVELDVSLERAAFGPGLRAAALGGDRRELEALLGSDAIVCCCLAPDRQDHEDDEPSRDDDEIVARSAAFAAS